MLLFNYLDTLPKLYDQGVLIIEQTSSTVNIVQGYTNLPGSITLGILYIDQGALCIPITLFALYYIKYLYFC